MGTETTFHLTVHDCPPAQVRAVVAALDEYAMQGAAAVERGRITLGVTYEASEIDPCNLASLVTRLLTHAPDATWTAYTTPTDEEMGQFVRRTPLLGIWRARCDFAGEPNIPRQDVLAARGAGERAMDVLLGLAWDDVIGALHLDRRGETVAAWPAGHRTVWRNDSVTVHAAADGGDLVLEVGVPYGEDLDEVEKVVDAHIAPALLAAGFAVVPGTWTQLDPCDGSMEGEVLAQVTADADRQARLRPTAAQLAAARAALDATPAADSAVVALALPGKLHQGWAVGQPVEAVDGLWLISQTDSGAAADAPPVTSHAAVAAAVAAAEVHLVDSDRVGVPCHVQIRRDGTWSVVEGRAISHQRPGSTVAPTS